MAIVLGTVLALRAKHKKSQEEMAEKLGITRASYGNKEKGKTEFTASELGVMAQEFNVTTSKFYEEI